MKTIVATIFTLILWLSWGQCNPTLRYRFCQTAAPTVCQEEFFGSNSSFQQSKKFDRNNGIIKLDEVTTYMTLFIVCTDIQPLRWVVTTLGTFSPVLKSEKSFVHVQVDNTTQYYYKISLRNLETTYSVIRCERFNESYNAAEVLLTRDRTDPLFALNQAKYQYFNAKPNKDGNVVIPCAMSGLRSSYKWDQRELHVTARSNRVLTDLTDDCKKCMCQNDICGATTNCNSTSTESPYYYSRSHISRCGPYSVTKEQWVEAGRPMLVGQNLSDTENAWRHCAWNTTCTELIIQGIKKDIVRDCTRDGLLTCHDVHSAFKSYPSYSCSSPYYSEYTTVENCLNQIDLQPVDPDGIKLSDRRFGFLIKADQLNFDNIYVCSAPKAQSESDGLQYMTLMPLSPEKEMNATMHFAETPRSRAKGIICLVHKAGITAQITNIPCETLIDCQLYFNYKFGFVYLRNTTEGAHKSHTLISEVIPSFQHEDGYSGTILRPSYYGDLRTGIMSCSGDGYKDGGFVQNHDYLFTGLDGKLHLLSEGPPARALMKLTGNGTTASCTDANIFPSATCLISKFILFPEIQFKLFYTNGTVKVVTSETAQSSEDDWSLSLAIENQVSTKLSIMLANANSIHAVSCSAPWMNSTGWLTQTLQIKAHFPLLGVNKATNEFPSVVVSFIMGVVIIALVCIIIFMKRREVYNWISFRLPSTSANHQPRRQVLLTVPSLNDISRSQPVY